MLPWLLFMLMWRFFFILFILIIIVNCKYLW